MSVTLFFDLYTGFAAAILGFARLAPIFFMLPFLNSGVLTGVPRQAVIVLVALGFQAYVGRPLPDLDGLAFCWDACCAGRSGYCTPWAT
jgi:type III secretion protein T